MILWKRKQAKAVENFCYWIISSTMLAKSMNNQYKASEKKKQMLWKWKTRNKSINQ